MKINHSHHDAIFKKFFSDIAIARDFFEIPMPKALRRQCNFNTLALCSGSFVEANLRQHCSDMLYSVRTRRGRGYIYCLVEHQSSPQKLMAFRLMRYSLAAMQQHLDQGHKELPIVMPLLLYQGGRGRYPYKNDWPACFHDKELARSVYHRPFPVIDLAEIPDEEIMTHRRVALLELVQKHIRIRDLSPVMKDIVYLINQWQPAPEIHRGLITYLAQAGKTGNLESFIQALSQQPLLIDKEQVMKTIAEHLMLRGQRRGHLKGKMEGKREGKSEGVLEGKLEVARYSLADGIDPALVKKWTGLSDGQLEQLMP